MRVPVQCVPEHLEKRVGLQKNIGNMLYRIRPPCTKCTINIHFATPLQGRLISAKNPPPHIFFLISSRPLFTKLNFCHKKVCLSLKICRNLGLFEKEAKGNGFFATGCCVNIIYCMRHKYNFSLLLANIQYVRVIKRCIISPVTWKDTRTFLSFNPIYCFFPLLVISHSTLPLSQFQSIAVISRKKHHFLLFSRIGGYFGSYHA